MRIGVSRVLIGVLITVLFSEVAIRLFDPILPGPSVWPTVSTEVKASQLLETPHDPTILMVGSSITDAAIRPDLLDDLVPTIGGSYNAAIPFSSPLVLESWLDTLLTETDPELTILGLPIWPARSVDFASELATELSNADNEERSAMRMASALWANHGMFAHWDRLFARERTISRGLWDPQGHFTGYYDLVGGSIGRQFQPFGEPRMSPQELDALQRVVGRLKSEGSDVIIVIEPGRFPGEVDERTVDAYIEWLVAQGETLGVPVWDTHGISWSDSHFADELHFNKSGVEVYTRHIADMIGDHLIAEESTAGPSWFEQLASEKLGTP